MQNIIIRHMDKGTETTYDGDRCMGIEIVHSGQMKIFLTSPNGGQITLYRLVDGDICIFSAMSMLRNVQFNVTTQFEKDTELYIIPKSVYERISEDSPAVKDFTLELVAAKFSDVLWIMNQLVFSGMGARLANVIIEHCELENAYKLTITHDEIAKDLGTAREVVTRLLKQFQLDGLVKLSRGEIEVLDMPRLMDAGEA